MRTGQQCLRWLCDSINYFIGQWLLLNNEQVYLHHNRSRFYISMSYCLLCLKFRCRGNGGWSRQNFSGVIQQPDPRKPPIRPIRKDLGDISYISRVIADVCPKFRCHGNRGWSQQNLSEIIQQPDPEKPLLYTKISRIYRIQAELQPILSQISLPWQRGLVAVEFVQHHSIARPRKPPVIRKDRADIRHIGEL